MINVRQLAADRPAAAAAVFVAVYLALAVLALPIAWWQLIGGFAFGLWYGAALSLVSSTAGAVAAAALARVLAADYFHRRVEAKLTKLRQLDRLLGHNGFLVVMTSRLIHFLPFGLSNYAFGLLEISFARHFRRHTSRRDPRDRRVCRFRSRLSARNRLAICRRTDVDQRPATDPAGVALHQTGMVQESRIGVTGAVGPRYKGGCGVGWE